MPWDSDVEDWLRHPVTIAFFEEVRQDINCLTTDLTKTDDIQTMLRYQGMLRALNGVLAMPEDGITNPATRS